MRTLLLKSTNPRAKTVWLGVYHNSSELNDVAVYLTPLENPVTCLKDAEFKGELEIDIGQLEQRGKMQAPLENTVSKMKLSITLPSVGFLLRVWLIHCIPHWFRFYMLPLRC